LSPEDFEIEKKEIRNKDMVQPLSQGTVRTFQLVGKMSFLLLRMFVLHFWICCCQFIDAKHFPNTAAGKHLVWLQIVFPLPVPGIESVMA